MKIYLNRNCSGYHWFEGSLSGDEEYIRLQYSNQVSATRKLLRGLMLHAQYEVCLAYEEGEYLLALNNIPEHVRTDEFGRPLSMQLILLSQEVEPLWKILFSRLQNNKEFSAQMSKCFASVIGGEQAYVRCKRESIVTLLNSCFKKTFSSEANKIMTKSSGELLFVNSNSRTIMKSIGFSNGLILKAEYSLRDCEQKQWLSDEDTTGSEIDIIDVEGLKKALNDARKENEELIKEIVVLRKNNTTNTPVSFEEFNSMKAKVVVLERDLEEKKREYETLFNERANFNKEFSVFSHTISRLKLLTIILSVTDIILLIMYLVK